MNKKVSKKQKLKDERDKCSKEILKSLNYSSSDEDYVVSNLEISDEFENDIYNKVKFSNEVFKLMKKYIEINQVDINLISKLKFDDLFDFLSKNI